MLINFPFPIWFDISQEFERQGVQDLDGVLDVPCLWYLATNPEK